MDHLSEPISGSAHLPVYRSKTKYGTGWSIDTTWTSRLRYRKLPSIESDIGDGPYRIIWTRYRSKRRNAAADGQAGSEPNGPNRSSGGMDGLPCDRPISEMILGRPSDRYRFGKQSAPECRGAFCMPCSGTDTEHTGKAIKTDIRTRNKAKRKASQKENTQKKKPSTTKSKTKEQAIQQQTENIHTHNQSRKPKTIPTKKKPRASCTRLRG